MRLIGHDDQSWNEEILEQFSDEMAGEQLVNEQVQLAQIKDIEILHTCPAYEKVPETEANGKSSSQHVGCGRNKGDSSKPDMRAKWKSPTMEKHLASCSPVGFPEVHFASEQFGNRNIFVLDASRAHVHPQCRRELFVRLLDEDGKGHVGSLLRTLYGTYDAAHAWDEYFNDAAVQSQCEVRLSSPCLYHHRAQDSCVWRHGDDLVFEGAACCVEDLVRSLGK